MRFIISVTGFIHLDTIIVSVFKLLAASWTCISLSPCVSLLFWLLFAPKFAQPSDGIRANKSYFRRHLFVAHCCMKTKVPQTCDGHTASVYLSKFAVRTWHRMWHSPNIDLSLFAALCPPFGQCWLPQNNRFHFHARYIIRAILLYLLSVQTRWCNWHCFAFTIPPHFAQ